jgi:hypothetical protein
MDDIAVDMIGGNILLIVRKAKGDQPRPAADKPLLQPPIAAIPLLADLLETFTAGRTNYCKQLDNGPEPTTFWAATRDENRTRGPPGPSPRGLERRIAPTALHPPEIQMDIA